jgi:hypothetical protein
MEMELVDSQTLRDVLRAGALSIDRVAASVRKSPAPLTTPTLTGSRTAI